VHVPAAGARPASTYRDFSLLLADQDPVIGQSAMPYPRDVSGPALVNYRSADPDHRRQLGTSYFSSAVNGDPQTPILQAYAGDPLVVHVINAPGSEQLHTISLGGLSWPVDPNIHNADEVTTRGLGPQEKLDAEIVGGAGGRTQTAGDYIYQDRRLPFTEAGMWGLIRVLPRSSCTLKTLDGSTCSPTSAAVASAPSANLALFATAAILPFAGASRRSSRRRGR